MSLNEIKIEKWWGIKNEHNIKIILEFIENNKPFVAPEVFYIEENN